METVTLAGVVVMFLLLLIITVLGYLQLKQIHSAVNSNMTSALNKIEDLHGRVAELVEESSALRRKKRRKPKPKPKKRTPARR